MVREHLWGLCDEMCESACVGGDEMVREHLWGLCDGMCESACGGFATGCVVFGLEKRNCDLNHKNLRIDLVQIKKFRSEP